MVIRDVTKFREEDMVKEQEILTEGTLQEIK
jgi:hypothetical protein